MREIDFEKPLNTEIETSNNDSKLKDGILTWLIIFGMITASSIVAYCFLTIFSVNIGISILALIGASTFLGEIIKSINVSHNKKKSKKNLRKLTEELSDKGLKVSVNSLQQTLITENVSRTEEINNIGQNSITEETIKRFYMLDEDDQIRVLQETFRTFRSFDGSYELERKLFLLEDEDLKNIEMPQVVKKLSFEKK